MSEKHITLSDFFVSDSKITCELRLSDNIKKYFLAKRFEIDYGQTLINIDESILAIPPLSSIITIAWTIGANIYLETIDETYLHSLRKIQSLLKREIPKVPFSTNINPRMVKKNKFGDKGHCLLFSGGVDSLSSYLRNKEKKPMLISLLGHYRPLYQSEPIEKYEKWLQSFADSEGLDCCIVKTTFKEILNQRLLKKFGRQWWINIDHSVMPLAHSAPLLTANKKGSVIVSSTWTKDYMDTILFHPLIDNNMYWADIDVIHDAYELSRHEKIQKILKNNIQYGKWLRVCSNIKYIESNCGDCGKCLATITSLILEDLDPNDFNFNIGLKILDKVEDYLVDGSIPRGFLGHDFFWKNIQNHIPENIESNKIYDSTNFFEWFKRYDYSLFCSKNTQKNRYTSTRARSIIKRYYYMVRFRGLYYAINHFFKLVLSELEQ